jgi:phosphate starvation-inducible membrane PsiE
MAIEKTEALHQRLNRLSDVVGNLLVDAFHYLALFAIGAAVVWSAVHAFAGMVANGRASVEDILLLFIYLELGAMVGIYFKTKHMPVRFLIYVGITALTRLLVGDVAAHHKLDWGIVPVPVAILLLRWPTWWCDTAPRASPRRRATGPEQARDPCRGAAFGSVAGADGRRTAPRDLRRRRHHPGARDFTPPELRRRRARTPPRCSTKRAATPCRRAHRHRTCGRDDLVGVLAGRPDFIDVQVNAGAAKAPRPRPAARWTGAEHRERRAINTYAIAKRARVVAAPWRAGHGGQPLRRAQSPRRRALRPQPLPVECRAAGVRRDRLLYLAT